MKSKTIDLKDKILSCYGKMTAKSVSNILGCSKDVVYNTWKNNGLEIERINIHRSRSYHMNKTI